MNSLFLTHFKDKIAIITGAASGIGRALSEQLAARGAIVIAADINERGLSDTKSSITGAGDRAQTVLLDVTESAQVQDLVDRAVSTYGRLDLMFNNAGIAVLGEVRDLTLEHWRRIVEVNLLGVIYGSVTAYKVMAAQGCGHIVNIASLAAWFRRLRLSLHTRRRTR